MRKHMKYHGINIENNNGLPVVAPSPDISMASLPDGYWNLLIDPDNIIPSPPAAMNRATGDMRQNMDNDNISLTQFPNGATAFSSRAETSIRFSSDQEINGSGWTVFVVLQQLNLFVGVEDLFNSRAPDASSPGRSLRVSIVQSGREIVVYEHGGRVLGGTQLLTHVGDYRDRNEPTLLMVTFSEERGLAIFDNGVQVAYAPDEREPLRANTAPGEWWAFENARSNYGLTGQLNADLGLPRNTLYRKLIEQHLASKYGITGMAE